MRDYNVVYADGSDPIMHADEAVCPKHGYVYLEKAGCSECYFEETGNIRKLIVKEVIK